MKKMLIQDQGGWITYPQYAKELGFELVEIKTDYGLIDLAELGKKADKDSIVLINSMPGYIAYENMKKISEIAEQANATLVNDASGSIGSEEGKAGGIIFGSFGRWKPLNAGYGGFIAADGDVFRNILNEMGSVFDEKFAPKLLEKLEKLDERTKFLKNEAKKVKKEIGDIEIRESSIIHLGAEGFNVAVKFKDEKEKEKILNYCKQKGYDYTECPRYIRVNEKAVCIEAKRKEEV
jgi:hypothetical protein